MNFATARKSRAEKRIVPPPAVAFLGTPKGTSAMLHATTLLSQREKNRILAHIDNLQKAREAGHKFWLAHADCYFKQCATSRRASGRLEPGKLDTICAALNEAADDLEAE